MSHPLRRTHLLRTILETLDFARGFAVPEEALRPQVDGLVRPPSSDPEWASAIEQLSSPVHGAIVRIPAELDPELVQWAITERGRVLKATL